MTSPPRVQTSIVVKSIAASQHVPMRFEERGPRGLPLSVRSRFDAVRFEDVADGRVGDVVADVGQRTLDAVVSPGRILFGEPQDQVHDHLANAGSAD